MTQMTLNQTLMIICRRLNTVSNLTFPSCCEKLKLLCKSTSRNFHFFIQTLPTEIHDSYSALCLAFRDEYSVHRDPAAALLDAFKVQQEIYKTPRLRKAYFQQRYPKSENDDIFKSFLCNLHETVRQDVTSHCRRENLSMTEARRYAQLVWEMRVSPVMKGGETKARV